MHLIHPFSQYLLSAYFVAGNVPYALDCNHEHYRQGLCSQGAYILVEVETDNKNN